METHPLEVRHVRRVRSASDERDVIDLRDVTIRLVVFDEELWKNGKYTEKLEQKNKQTIRSRLEAIQVSQTETVKVKRDVTRSSGKAIFS